jgi:putative heme-binding domain-containing protein
MQYDLPLDQTTMIGQRPTQGEFGMAGAQVIAAGDPCRSVLLYRISKTGGGRMPHIGSQIVDPEGVALIEDWIESLKAAASAVEPAGNAVAQRRTDERRLLERLKSSGPAAEERGVLVDQLLSTTSGALSLLRAVDRKLLPKESGAFVVQKATRRTEIPVRDLFEKFLPEEQRVKRLGSMVRPEQILRLTGDEARGRRIFFETEGVQCKNCHRVQKTGREVGPDLDQIGKKYNSGQLLESILEPSKFIDPKYVSYLVETKGGRLHTGLLVKKDGSEVVLKDAEDKTIRIPAGEVERLAGQRASLMPELQVRDLTAQQVADLVAYLGSLK